MSRRKSEVNISIAQKQIAIEQELRKQAESKEKIGKLRIELKSLQAQKRGAK